MWVDRNAKRQSADAEPDLAGILRRGRAAGARDTEYHVLSAAVTAEEQGPCALHDVVESDAVECGEIPQPPGQALRGYGSLPSVRLRFRAGSRPDAIDDVVRGLRQAMQIAAPELLRAGIAIPVGGATGCGASRWLNRRKIPAVEESVITGQPGLPDQGEGAAVD